MAKVNRLFRWMVELYRAGYEGHIRFMCDFYGVAPPAKLFEISEIAYLERLYRDSPDVEEERTP